MVNKEEVGVACEIKWQEKCLCWEVYSWCMSKEKGIPYQDDNLHSYNVRYLADKTGMTYCIKDEHMDGQAKRICYYALQLID